MSNALCHNVAVSDDGGSTITIHCPDYELVNSFGSLELIPPLRSDNDQIRRRNFEDVQVVRLDDFSESVYVIKIDIEGMEDRAFKGAMTILTTQRPICFIEILKTDVEYIINLFRGLGYVGFRKKDDLIAFPKEFSISINGLVRIF